VDGRIEAVVHRLLQKEPAKRFPAALEVVRELDKVSPDPARRAMALARVVTTLRRPVQGPPTLESERATASRDLGPTLRIAAPTNQQGPLSSTAGRPVDSSKAPRSVRGDSQQTLRSPASSPTRSEPARDAAAAPPRSLRADAVRPFPAHFIGRFQVRGPVLSSVDRAIVDLFGVTARDEVVSRMPDAYAAELRNDSINALVAYDLEAVDAYMEHATSTLIHDPKGWRDLGNRAVDGELYSLVRTLLRPAGDAAGVLRRSISTWARLFSFGTWRVNASSTGKVTLIIGELDAVAQPLRFWIVGVIEQTTRRAVRGDLRVTVTSGDQDFAPEMVCEIE
jgi:serine/threonine-protein kinase